MKSCAMPAVDEPQMPLRKRESDTERRLREAEERIALLTHDKRVLTEALRGIA